MDLSPIQTLSHRGFRALNGVVLPAVKAGLGSPLPIGAGIVVVESTGRVSGERRQVPLVAIRFGRRVRVSTVRSSSQWAKNLDAVPSASVWLRGRKRSGTAAVSTGRLTTAAIDLDAACSPSGP